MLKLKKGDNASKAPIQIDLEKRSATVNHIWKAHKDAECRYQLTFTYDFSRVDEKDIWRYAAMWVNKDYQNRLRLGDVPTDEALEAMEKTPIDVAEMYTRKTRAPMTPEETVKKLLAQGFTKEQLLSLFGEEDKGATAEKSKVKEK